ncbi:hypothetical protein GGR52DRAFT_582973 [Hypoxylon sp. FL1284]|nr:hypothetical protein GGR52DRAFT_582973 [Hypoxylon sp. FL1284]
MEAQAIVGFAFKLPGGTVDEDSLWDVLEQRKNLAQEWPSTRASIRTFSRTSLNETGRKLPTPKAYFVEDDPAAFDAPFFSITAQEAAAMDPQQRWALETAYHAFESSGIPMEDLRGSRTAVFTGSMSDDYVRLLAKDPDTMPRTTITGTSPSILANRISWFFDLQGPSINVDSACSTSMMALDLAFQALNNGSASQALVIGSSIILNPEHSLMLSNMGFLSPNGVSNSFDHRADGYARGEGCIAMILKPVTSSVRDGNTIRAVIRSIGSNQDGRTPTLTHPSGSSQEKLIREVYSKAGLGFESTRYVEAHGTGTPTGDPIEFAAIASVFKRYRTSHYPLFVGSIKTNIGHLEGASGLAGVLKSILILERGSIPPNALFERINPAIEYDSSHVHVPTTCLSWPISGPRRVSVNSFGFGGLDFRGIHNCLFSTPENGYHDSANGKRHRDDQCRTACASSTTKHLLRMIRSYELFYEKTVAERPSLLPNLAYTLSAHRSIMSWRAFAVLDSSRDQSLRKAGVVAKPIRASSHNNMVLVFTGQGASYAGMGLALQRYTVFQDALRRADDALRDLGCCWSIFDQLLNHESIRLPQYSQPICTALQIALTLLIRSFGVRPVGVVGHSSGEIAAAYAIGAISFESAMNVAFHRGRLAGIAIKTAHQTEAMMSVNLSEKAVRPYLEKAGLATLDHDVYISCVNSPSNCTVSGSEDKIDSIKRHLDSDQIFAAKLSTGIAYHSPSMLAISKEYADAIGDLDSGELPEGEITMFSSVTGGITSREELLRTRYWVDNLVSIVRFSDAVIGLLNRTPPSTVTDFLEVGPHSALRGPVKDILSQKFSGPNKPRYHSLMHKSKDAVQTTLEVIGGLFCLGYPVAVAKSNQLQPDYDNDRPCSHTRSTPLDCPKYPFDHSQRYWKEPRIAQGFRFRAEVPADALGAPVMDWNPLEPRWRNLISMQSAPWVGDHVLDNTAIYPGGGLLIMSIEALRQTASPNRSIFGFFIKEAHFLSPVIVEESASEPTELMVHLRRIQNPYERESTWSEILIYTYVKDRWAECFRATAQIQYEEPKSGIQDEPERELELERIGRSYDAATVCCTTTISSRKFYTHALDSGFKYGDCFRLLQDIHWNGGGISTARIKQPGPTCRTASLAHPSTMDNMVQLSIAQVSKGCSQPLPACVPYQLFDTWMSARGWDCASPDSRLRLASYMSSFSGSRAEASIYVLSDDGSPLANMGRLVMASISSKPADGRSRDHRFIHRIDWQPQLSLQSPQQLRELCNAKTTKQDETEPAHFYQRLEAALIKSVEKTLGNLPQLVIENAMPHEKRFLSSMQYLIEKHEASGTADEVADDSCAEFILDQVERSNPSWSIFPVIARNLERIFLGQTDVLEILFEAGLAENLYRSIFDHICDQRFYRYIELASHENPGLKIIEIGAGTGGMTRHVTGALRALELRTGTSRFQRYDYTDISPSFFAKAKEEFDGPRFSFQALDIEKDVASQGFEVGAYDLVIAGSVLHATSSLETTLGNVHRLLRPGGQILFLEVVSPESVCTMVGFGLLPGWWLGQEQHRQRSPLITEGEWDEALKQSGFTGTDLVIRDYENDACHLFSIMLSTVRENPESAHHQSSTVETEADNTMNHNHGDGTMRHIVFIIDGENENQLVLVEGLAMKFNAAEVVYLNDLRNVQFSPDDIVVSLLEVERPLLASISEEDFQGVQHSINSSRNLVWVASARPQETTYSYSCAMTGLFRTIRAEASEKRISTLAVESDECVTAETLAGHLDHVIATSGESTTSEVEFIVRNGHIMSGRMIEDVEFDDAVRALVFRQRKVEPLGVGPPLSLSVGTVGMLDTLQFVEDNTLSSELGEYEMEVEAKAWASDGPGWDCTGVVKRAGSRSAFHPGDRVGLGLVGSMRTSVMASSKTAFKIPEGVSFEDAVSFINPGCTAYHCLVNLAHLQKDEKILIHSAAGSTGQMAIWIAKHCGAEIFATVGSVEKKHLLVERFGIPPSHIFHSRSSAFAQGIARLTGGAGVDVVLNSLSGDKLKATWDCIAAHGRFVEIGKVDIASNSSLPMGNFLKNVSFFAFDIVHLASTKPDLISGLVRKVQELICNGIMHYPHPRHVFSASEVEKAFRLVQGGTHAGRVVVRVNPSDSVPKFIRAQSEWKFNDAVSYLIVGGLGGIGRAVCKWMVSKGAKYLILPSRSGPSSAAASATIQELRSQGAVIETPVCDASSFSALSSCLEACAKIMPPIRGCINSAMALQDCMFEAMNHAQWDLALRTKVQTSWNLHQLLREPLDFFILLSSVSGLFGGISQSNYAAGCTFQDALARYRSLQGEKAISLDLGWMKTIGIIAERDDYERNRRRARDMIPIEEDEFLALLDLCCDPLGRYQQPDTDKCQIIIGATTPAFFHSRGERPIARVQRRMFSGLTGIQEERPRPETAVKEDHAALFKQASGPQARAEVVTRALVGKLAKALSMSVDDIDTERALSDYGVDSLMAVELRNWFNNDFQAEVTVFSIMDSIPIAGLGELVLKRSKLTQ